MIPSSEYVTEGMVVSFYAVRVAVMISDAFVITAVPAEFALTPSETVRDPDATDDLLPPAAPGYAPVAGPDRV